MTRTLALALLLALTSKAVAGQSLRALRQLSTSDPAPKDSTSCDYAIVGGGPGGVYTAFRLLEEQISDNVCLFEATQRVGGRVYSVRNLGPNNDMVLDMGAYRYMPLAQPIITNLIQNQLKLPNRLYQPGVPDYKVITTEDGQNAGFATYVEGLLDMAQGMGLKVTFNARIVQLVETGSGFQLMTEAGAVITSSKVVLNLPTRPLHRLLQNSILPSAEYSPALDQSWIQRATKLYLYYPTAWWIEMGLYNGSLAGTESWEEVGVEPPIVARYHDGHVKCAKSEGNGYSDFYYNLTSSINTQSCYGYFQMIYTSDDGSDNTTHEPVDFLTDYMGSLTTIMSGATTDVPYAVINSSIYGGAHLLEAAHNRLVTYHRGNGTNIPANALPTEAVISLWDPSVTWVGGAWHSMKLEENEDNAQATYGALKPFADLDLYVADEAYSTQLGWSEGSLVMAENIIRSYLGGGLPSWLPEQEWQRANLTSPGFDDTEGAAQGGGGSSGQGSAPVFMAPAPAPDAEVLYSAG